MTHSDTRLYGSAIAIVSGLYSILAAMDGGMAPIPTGATLMLVVGVAALLHGIVLLTPAAGRISGISGPLMLVWATVMLANQALAATLPDWMMRRPMMDGGSMAWDGGMVAAALLMLVSGLIMTRRRRMP